MRNSVFIYFLKKRETNCSHSNQKLNCYYFELNIFGTFKEAVYDWMFYQLYTHLSRLYSWMWLKNGKWEKYLNAGILSWNEKNMLSIFIFLLGLGFGIVKREKLEYAFKFLTIFLSTTLHRHSIWTQQPNRKSCSETKSPAFLSPRPQTIGKLQQRTASWTKGLQLSD